MATPKRLNDMDKESIEKNFLLEDPELPTEERVVVAKEVTKYEKVRFHNLRDPGVTLHFHYHSKTHPLKHYDLIHDQIYDLPIEVIKHLEGEASWDPHACHTRIYGRKMDAEGKSVTFVNGYRPCFQLKTVRA